MYILAGRSTSCPEKFTYSDVLDKCYYYSGENQSFEPEYWKTPDDARAACASMGGNMAMGKTAEERAALFELTIE